MTRPLAALLALLAASPCLAQHRYQMDRGVADSFAGAAAPTCYLNEFVSVGSTLTTLNCAFRARPGTVIWLCLWLGEPGDPRAARLVVRR